MLFDAYSEINRMDDDNIKQDFHELYAQINGMSLQEMDKIIFIEEGKVVAVGNHATLMNTCPSYRSMVELQKLDDAAKEA